MIYRQKVHSSSYISVAESVGVPCIFNHFYYVMGPEIYRVRRNDANYTAITPFMVIQGHRFCHRSKARIRLPISD